MKRQFHIFLNAVMFYTRIPVPRWMWHDEEMLNRATIYFPVIGWGVGGFCALVYWTGTQVFSAEVALLLSMIGSVWLTGAFHEDGFADVCDGFGGGWTRARILEIMKDSRVGAYGVIGMVLLLGLKFFALRSVSSFQVGWVLVLGHTLSRTTALTLIFTDDYARENEEAKAKPVAKKMPVSDLVLALALGLLPLAGVALWLGNAWMLSIFVPLAVLKLYLSRYFTRWIGGYTGDCLGATQQLAEVLVYLFFSSILWTST